MSKTLIQNPIISEKSSSFAASGKYVFKVPDNATKSEVKKAVEREYKVIVVKTNVLNTTPKPKRYGRNVRLVPGFKKVLVTLKSGQKLDIIPQ